MNLKGSFNKLTESVAVENANVEGLSEGCGGGHCYGAATVVIGSGGSRRAQHGRSARRLRLMISKRVSCRGAKIPTAATITTAATGIRPCGVVFVAHCRRHLERNEVESMTQTASKLLLREKNLIFR